MQKYKLALLLLLTAFLASSCGWLNGPEKDAPLTGTKWQLLFRSLPNQPSSGGGGNEYSLVLDEAGGVSGQASCNSCGGHYMLSAPDSIEFEIGCTEIACQDGWISTPFPVGKAACAIDGSSLTLRSADGSVFFFLAVE